MVRNGVASVLKSEFRNLRTALHSFEKTLQRAIVTNGAGNSAGNGRTRRRRLSAKARASLVLQGRYMGYMRQLKLRQKAQVRKVKQMKGVRAAISRARALAAAVR